MKRLSQRYLVATVAFTVAAIWTGLSVIGAFDCLIAFTLAYAIAGFVLRGNARLDRERSRDSRHSRGHLRDDAYGRHRASSPRPARVVYDLDRPGPDNEWARAVDGGW
jgi:uncharacterized membrane protein